MNPILVTGSTGNVGREVASQLEARGIEVRRTIRPNRDGDATLPAGTVAFDFQDPATFAAALTGVDAVFFMRPPHMSDAREMQPFVDAMRDAHVRHVVFLSVQGAGSNPFVPHHGIEKLLRRSGLDWTFLRPSFFMQNLSTTHLDDIRERGEIYVPAGRGKTNFIDAADIAEAAAVCLTTPSHARKAYEITGSEALTYHQIAQILTQATGTRITYPQPTAKQFKARMLAQGHDQAFVSVMSAIYALARYGMAAGTTQDFERLAGRPPVTFEQWARANAATFRPAATVHA